MSTERMVGAFQNLRNKHRAESICVVAAVQMYTFLCYFFGAVFAFYSYVILGPVPHPPQQAAASEIMQYVR